MIPVILSGGSGTRLWPLSREAFPKQFLALVGSDSMLQAIEPVPAAMDLNVATTMEAPLPILASYSTKLTPSLLK